jgi:hypothetical protein
LSVSNVMSDGVGAGRARWAVAAALLSCVLAPAHARAGAAPDLCAEPPTSRPPDLRCGETLDGRAPVTPSAALALPRAALVLPRLATWAVLWPLAETSELVESYHLVDWMNAVLTTDDGRVGVRPIVKYATDFRSSFGARLFYRRGPLADGELAAEVQSGGLDATMGQLELRGPRRLGLAFIAGWSRRPDRLFAGIGPRSDADLAARGQGAARFGVETLNAGALWSRPLTGWLVAYARGDVTRRRYSARDVSGGPSVATLYGLPPETCATAGLDAPCVDPREMPGFDRGLRLVHAGGGLTFGLREPGREGAGFSLALDAALAQGLAGDPSQHLTISAETVRAFGHVNRALILRARVATVQRLRGSPVPFEELVIASGPDGMRGFADGRFRGHAGLVATAEYRWYVSSYLDAALFSDVGTVARPAFTDVAWNRWFPSFGLAFRLFKTKGPYWEATAASGVQLAYAPDGGLRLLLSMARY